LVLLFQDKRTIALNQILKRNYPKVFRVMIRIFTFSPITNHEVQKS
jgi:hypothetical protein